MRMCVQREQVKEKRKFISCDLCYIDIKKIYIYIKRRFKLKFKAEYNIYIIKQFKFIFVNEKKIRLIYEIILIFFVANTKICELFKYKKIRERKSSKKNFIYVYN